MPGTLTLTVAETADELRVSRPTVERLIRDGRLPSLKVGGRRLISRRALEEWIAAQEPRTEIAF